MGDQQQIDYLINVFRLGKNEEAKNQQKISIDKYL